MTTGEIRRFSDLASLLASGPFDELSPDGRVLVISSGVRGLAVAADRFASIVADSGTDVVVVASRPGLVKAQPRRAPRPGVSLFDQVRHRRRWRHSTGMSGLPDVFRSFSGIFIAGTGPAMSVIEHTAMAGVPSAVLIDVTMERHAQQNDWRRNWWFRDEQRREAACFSKTDRVVSVSEWCRASVIDDLGIDPSKLVVVCPVLRRSEAANTLPERSHSAPVRLVAIGSPWIRKGMDRTIDWLGRRPDLEIELHLIGDAPPSVEDTRVTVHGRVDGGSLVQDLLPTFDLLVHPTRRDQSSTVVVEAAWSGVASLASPMAGIPELIEHDVTGWLLDDQSEAVLDRRLDSLIADRPALAAAGRAARQKAERDFDADLAFAPLVAWLSGRGPVATQEPAG